MLGWVGDIERQTLENDTFRTVVFTGDHQQLTVMRLAPGEDIGLEMHPNTDQFLRIESGTARVEFGKTKDTIDETMTSRTTGRSSSRRARGTTSSTPAKAT